MAQPDCCCRLTQAEINVIVASGCVWRPPSLHEIILIPNVSISISCSSHVSFERSGSTWTNFQTQCNLWKRKKARVSCKLSDASRINSLCLIPKLSKSMAQPDCCCRLKQAEKSGIVASGCVCGDRRASMKLSCFHMMSVSPSALHMFRLKDLVLLEPNSKLSATYENGKKRPSHTSYLPRRA